jgi:hypothetical protein
VCRWLLLQFALEGIEIACRLPFEAVLISSCLMVYMPGFPAKHLGITYQENGKINIEERLSIGRRTIYALLGPGLHARSDRNVPSSSTENLEYIR